MIASLPRAHSLVFLALLYLTTATAQSSFTKASNDSLLWGAYRPNLYFGIRPRIPKSIMTGLAWARVDSVIGVQQNFRYTCEQHEGMAGYGWDSYDPRLGGVQTIHDDGNGVDIVTEFVKFVDRGDNGGSWAARVRGTPRHGQPADLTTAIVFNLGLEGFGTLEVLTEGDNGKLGFEQDVVIKGQTPELGSFTLTVTRGKGKTPAPSHPAAKTNPLDRTRVHSMQVPEAAIWQSKVVMFSSMKETVEKLLKEYGQKKLPPAWQIYDITNMPGRGNLHLVQKTFEGAFEFDIMFSSSSARTPIQSSEITPQVEKVTGAIRERYSHAQKPAAPFDDPKYFEFSMSLFSNLIGGIGYFHGDQMVDRSYATEYDEDVEGFWQDTAEARAREEPKLEGPYELFTSIPSRPFFPRGFSWDEGFHLLPIVDFDVELTLQVIKSWLGTMDDNGWFPREQILGPEARSKVPAEFQVQYPHYANPPTLFLVLTALIDKIESRSAASAQQQPLGAHESPEQIRKYLTDLYPLLKRHFEWFRSTQRGELKAYDRQPRHPKEAYRWRGSTKTHLLTSGMDDYPRADTPHPGELHLDLLSWVGMMARSMARIAQFIKADDAETYTSIATAVTENLDDLHWVASENAYCDQTVDEYEETIPVCHKGYLSLFPFMLGLLDPSSPQLGASIDLLTDPAQLWSAHGIRSLSPQDAFYGKDENYWRSPVWMNMNYLIATQLRAVAQQQQQQKQQQHPSGSPYATKAGKAFNALRRNLVTTVYESWRDTGFAWEQYHPETGKGQRTQHFTGWTSLVVKIMAMEDVDVVGGEGEGPAAVAAAPAERDKQEL